MLKNYFRVAVRNLLRSKSASLIKILSLSVGMVCFSIISLFVYHELSYDRFHTDPEDVYRIVKDFVNDDGSRVPDATTPPALAPVAQKDIPEIAFTTRVFPNWGRKYLLRYGDTQSYEERVLRIDSSFFDVFTFPFIKGENSKTTFSANSIILTRSSAARLFGDLDPIGKSINVDFGPQGTDLFVTGVVEDVPENSHFTFDFLISLRTFQGSIDDDWGFYNFYTYVRLKPEADPQGFIDKLQPLFKKYQPDNDNEFYTQALTDIHLKSNLKWELSANGDYSYIRILATIALFTVLLAAINYINLVTAQSSRRAKEVGIRKVSGAVKGSLIRQFLLESIMMAMIATIVSLAVAESILPAFEGLFNSTLSFLDTGNTHVLLMVVGIGLSTGLLAGLYPAFYLSAFQPVKVLKGSASGLSGDTILRKGLVTFQFIISTVLIIGAFVISSQIDFIKNKKLGFDKENVMLINNARNLSSRDALLTEIKRVAGVVNAGAANGVLGGQNWTTIAQAKGNTNSLLLNFITTDHDFLDVMAVHFLEGRNFSRDNKADTLGLILNETAVNQLGIKPPVIGSAVNFGSDEEPFYYYVTGVIGDFHFTSFHEPIKPFGFFLDGQNVSTLFVKIDHGNVQASLDQIRNLWTTHVADRPFEFSFQDEQVNKLYSDEVKFQKLFSIFTYVAIIIACLGVFGLSAYTAQRRTKEIGIRKVLGATVFGVTGLLSKEFLKLVLLAVVIAVPIAWYGMEEWLQNFSYRVDLQVWMFLVSGFVAILIAMITVSFQSVKAGLANPVNSLRNE